MRREEKVLGGRAAVFHGAGGGSRKNQDTEGGVGNEFSVAQERRNAGERGFIGDDNELPGLVVHGSGSEAGAVDDLIDGGAVDGLRGVAADTAA